MVEMEIDLLPPSPALHGFDVATPAWCQGTGYLAFWTLLFSWAFKNTCDGEFNLLLHDKVKRKTGDDEIVEAINNSPSSLSYPMVPSSIIAHYLFIYPFLSAHFQMLCLLVCPSGLNRSSWHLALKVSDEIGLNGITSLAMKLRADFSVPSLSHPLFLTTHPPPALGCLNVIRCYTQLVEAAGLELLVRSS